MGIKKVRVYCAAMIRVVGMITCALFLPWFFLIYQDSPYKKYAHSQKPTEFKLGIENLTPTFIASIRPNKKIWKAGLVINHTSYDQMGTSSLQRLQACGVMVSKIFSPEQSFHIPIPRDNTTPAICVVGLHNTADTHRLFEQHINSLDAIFFDMQNTGIRHYYAINLLFELLKISALYHKTVIVLDRPNGLGASIEGNLPSQEANIDCLAPLPLRYGMTIGELARYFNGSVLKKAAPLFVVPMQGYARAHTTDVEHSSTSLATCIDVDHGTSLFNLLTEVHPFDMATETEHAYHCILLPEKMYVSKKIWYELKALLQEKHIETVFYNYYNAKKKQRMQGLRVIHQKHNELASFAIFLSIVRFFKEKGIAMTFSEQFDKIIGNKNIRAYVEGRLNWDQLEIDINKGLKEFYAHACRAFLYKPYPKVTMM